MTDNFKQMYEYMKDLGVVQDSDQALKTDLFFDVQLIRRGKDHPDLPSANYTFKTYYIDNLNSFERQYDEMKKCCDMFGLRAYISVNAKSKREAAAKTLERYAHNNAIGEFRKPWKDFSSVCGSLDGEEKRWVVDCDNTDKYSDYTLEICRIICNCDSGVKDPLVACIPTKSGVHILTHPFNLKQFNDLCEYNEIEKPDIKKNHITLLYENLEKYGKDSD